MQARIVTIALFLLIRLAGCGQATAISPTMARISATAPTSTPAPIPTIVPEQRIMLTRAGHNWTLMQPLGVPALAAGGDNGLLWIRFPTMRRLPAPYDTGEPNQPRRSTLCTRQTQSLAITSMPAACAWAHLPATSAKSYVGWSQRPRLKTVALLSAATACARAVKTVARRNSGSSTLGSRVQYHCCASFPAQAAGALSPSQLAHAGCSGAWQTPTRFRRCKPRCCSIPGLARGR